MHDFYALYADYLTGICARYVGNGDSLKDVLQDCLVNIITHVGEFEYRGAGSLQAWATKIAVNQSLKFLKEQKHGEFVTLEWDVPDNDKYETEGRRRRSADQRHSSRRYTPLYYRTAHRIPHGFQPLCIRKQEPSRDCSYIRH